MTFLFILLLVIIVKISLYVLFWRIYNYNQRRINLFEEEILNPNVISAYFMCIASVFILIYISLIIYSSL